jgi:SWI/SNF-related matrix-associated actin-dependent regulator 1 of chromatin subfamily A
MFKRRKIDNKTVYITIDKDDDDNVFCYHVHTKNKKLLNAFDNRVIYKDDGFLVLLQDKDKVKRLIDELMPTHSQRWTNESIESLITSETIDQGLYRDVIPDGISIKNWNCAYDYQKKAILDTINIYNNRVLLSFTVGLGKTLTAALMISHWHHVSPGKHLIITPSGLKMNFIKEILKWSSFEKEELQVVKTGKVELNEDVKIYVMSYRIATDRIREINHLKISSIILDESHLLKTVDSNRSKVLIPLMIKVKRCMLLTATPLTSRSIEILTTLRMLLPEHFKNVGSGYRRFGYRYCGGKMAWIGRREIFECKGSTNLHELNLILNKCMIRITNDDAKHIAFPNQERHMIKLDGGDKTRQILNKGLAKIHSAQAKEDDTEFQANCKKKKAMMYFAEIQQVTMEAKIELVLDYIDRFVDKSATRSVIFAYNHAMMNAIQNLLENKGVKHIRIDGKVKPEKRQGLVDEFIADNECKTAILSIKAANAGLNIMTREEHLIPITTSIFAQLSFIPSDLIQCEGRITRSGGKFNVQHNYLILNESFEEITWRMLNNKTRNVSQVLDSKQSDFKVDNTLYDKYLNKFKQ